MPTEVVTFPIGFTVAFPPFQIVDDDINELPEFFTAELSLPISFSGLSLGTNYDTTVNIEDDEGKHLCIDYSLF